MKDQLLSQLREVMGHNMASPVTWQKPIYEIIYTKSSIFFNFAKLSHFFQLFLLFKFQTSLPPSSKNCQLFFKTHLTSLPLNLFNFEKFFNIINLAKLYSFSKLWDLNFTCNHSSRVPQEILSATCHPSCTWWQFVQTYSLRIWYCNQLHFRVSCPFLQQLEQQPTWLQHVGVEYSRSSCHHEYNPMREITSETHFHLKLKSENQNNV